jgi:CBS domain-containing protein
MPIIEPKRMLKGLKVREVMRRFAASIPVDSTIEQAIRCMIKNKINAVLATDKQIDPVGVVSKTDLMGAYYTSAPISSPVWHIMSTSVVTCSPDDTLEFALNIMQDKGLHRIYVSDDLRGHSTGVVSYPDIVGLLYRYCHRCERNVRKQLDALDRLRVKEVMTPRVRTLPDRDTILRVLEELGGRRFGALLITSAGGLPAGVISSTDLVLAYRHGVPTSECAAAIMMTPVRSCDQEEDLAKAIRQMVFCDIQRFFVYSGPADNIVGVFSLTDAAQARSGSCRACITSRMDVM